MFHFHLDKDQLLPSTEHKILVPELKSKADSHDTHDLSSDGSADLDWHMVNEFDVDKAFDSLSYTKASLKSSDIKTLEKDSKALIAKVSKLAKSSTSPKHVEVIGSTTNSNRIVFESNHSTNDDISAGTTSLKSNISIGQLSNQLQRLDLTSWYRVWKNKKRESKVQTLCCSLFPRLKSASETLHVWLGNIDMKKNDAVSQALKIYKEMIIAIEICQNHVNIYEDIVNDCLQIVTDLKKEIVDLKVSLEFGKEITEKTACRSHSDKIPDPIPHYGQRQARSHRARHSREAPSRVSHPCPLVNDRTITENSEVLAEPAVWHGYKGQEGKQVQFIKSPGLASVVNGSTLPNQSLASEKMTVNTKNMQIEDESKIIIKHTVTLSDMQSSSQKNCATNDSVKRPRRKSLSPQRLEHSSFMATVFHSNPKSLAKENDGSSERKNDFMKLPFKSLLSRRNSVGGPSDHEHQESHRNPTQLLADLGRHRSASYTPVPNHSSKHTMAISSSASSLNHNLLDYNMTACTTDLDHFFTESAILAKESKDLVMIDVIVQRMHKLKYIKDEVSKLIHEIKSARDVATHNEKICRQIRDDLQVLIDMHINGVSAANCKHVKDDDCSPDTPSTSEMFSLLSDRSVVSDRGLHSCSGLSDCGRSSPDHGADLLSNTKRKLSLHSQGAISVESRDSLEEYFLSHDINLLMETSSKVANQFIGDLKNVLQEEVVVRKQLNVIENLLDSTSSYFTKE